MRRAYTCLVWLVQTGSKAVPVDMPYLMKRLRKSIEISITASLKRERHQARVRNDEVFIVHGEFSLASSGSSGSSGGDGQ